MSSPMILLLVAIVFGLAIFYPTIVAFKRGARMRYAVLLINLFFGWTMVGWFVALMWAYGPTEEQLQWEAEREQLSMEADRAVIEMERRTKAALDYR